MIFFFSAKVFFSDVHKYTGLMDLKSTEKILKSNKKTLKNLQVNIFGWLSGNIYTYEHEMGARKSKIFFICNLIVLSSINFEITANQKS